MFVTGDAGRTRGCYGRDDVVTADLDPAARAGEAGRVARTALGVSGLLGLGRLAAATCLRWRELEVEERELALREREAGRRGPAGHA